MVTVTELLQPVETDLETLLGDLRSLIGAGHPILQAAAEHLFSAGGKRLRPGIVLLLSRALAADGQLTPRHRRLAEITEMIHTASLVHDDVVDEASTRRGVDTVHSRFDARVAVLAGDFLFAQASWHLANLDDLEVVKLLSRVIMDLADGEVKQGLFRFDTAQTFETYLEKSYCKTASLIANSAGLPVLSDCSPTNLMAFTGLAVSWVLPSRLWTTSSISPAATSNSANQLPVTSPVDISRLGAMPWRSTPGCRPDFRQFAGPAISTMPLRWCVLPAPLHVHENLRKPLPANPGFDWLMKDSASKRALLELPDFVLSRLY